jgi:hypothetical protein
LVAGELAVDLTNKRLYTEDSGGTVLELGTNPSGNVTFGDNGKAIFGAGSDLQIYHDGSNSWIQDAGTGVLALKTDGVGISMLTATGDTLFQANRDSDVRLYYDNALKLSTSSSGISVTGTVTADGATFSGAVDITANVDAQLTLSRAAGNNRIIKYETAGVSRWAVYADGVAEAGSDAGSDYQISYYNDAGVYQGNALTLTRATGAATFSGNVTAGGLLLTAFAEIRSDTATLYLENAANTRYYSTKLSGTNPDLVTSYYDGAAVTERLRIDASGNVGIGVVPSAWVGTTGLQLSTGCSLNGSTVNAALGANSYYDGTNWKYITSNPSTNYYSNYANNGSHVWQIAPSGTAAATITYTHAMTLDASGNLLVGTTDSDMSNNSGTADGFSVLSSGIITNAAQGITYYANRLGSNGGIIDFRKDGAPVGSIGTASGVTYFAGPNSSTGGFRIDSIGANGVIVPTTTTGANRDAALDLGTTAARFKDLYLSGGVYLGGTGAANLLDDYEEGDHTTSITCTTSGTVTVNPTFDSVSYIKIGQLVTVTGLIIVGSVSSPVGAFNISMPFAVTGSGVAKRGSDSAAAITVHNGVSANSSDYVSIAASNTSDLTIYLGDNPDVQTDSAQQLQTGTEIYFHITYRTD